MLFLVWLASAASTVVIGSCKGRSALTTLGLGLFLGPIGALSLLLSPAQRIHIAGAVSIGDAFPLNAPRR